MPLKADILENLIVSISTCDKFEARRKSRVKMAYSNAMDHLQGKTLKSHYAFKPLSNNQLLFIFPGYFIQL